jgi:peptide deformylase
MDTKRLTRTEIVSDKIRNLVANMRHTIEEESYGVGMSAPQVGESLAISIIAIKPTPNRPELKRFDKTLFNAEIIETYGRRVGMWEGCASVGSGDDILYAKVPRYKKVRVAYLDETGQRRIEVLDGFVAHVAQHEIDHLSGVMLVDRVRDKSTFMMGDEYKKRIVNSRA